MSDPKIQINQLEEQSTFLDNDLLVKREFGTTGTRREKKFTWATLKTKLAESLQFISGIVLTPGRKAFQELTSGTLNTPGWYTIAEAPPEVNGGSSADFTISGPAIRDTFKFYAEHNGSGAPKTPQNTRIEIISAIEGSEIVYQARLAKSDSVNNAGAKLQIKMESSATITILKEGNAGRSTGWQLVTPYLDNTPTLPDGVTPATFIEAGAELSLTKTLTFNPARISVIKINDDTLRASVAMPEIPKQGTGVLLAYNSFSLLDGTAANVTMTGAETYSSFSIAGNTLEFQINEIGKFTALNLGPLAVKAQVMDLTITG